MKTSALVLLLTLSGMAVCSGTYAQQEQAATTAAAANYSAEPIVIERYDRVYTMAADGSGSRLSTFVARVQSDAAVRQLGVMTIPYASDFEHVELGYVRVRHSDGSITETKASEAIEMPSPITTAAPYYSDLKQLQVPVRNLRVGDRLEWQAKIVRTKAEAPGQFWGQDSFVSDGVVLEESVELHVPRDIYVNAWSPSSKPTETSTATERVYRWESSQTKPTVGPEAEAEKERKKKQILTAGEELDAKEGKLPTIAWTTFKSWEEVGAWYRGLIGDRAQPGDAEVKAKVAEVTAGKVTLEEKVRAVYGYVSTQIRYVGVAFGIGRYQPHAAVQVLDNQYGDCKDKHTLLAAMLTQLGLHPDAVLIGAGVRFNEAVPALQAFNHVITRVSVDGQTVWLDSTAEVAPYRVLDYRIRDKQALIVPDTGASMIDRSPASLPFASVDRMEATGDLDETGVSHSHIVLTMRGDSELALRAAFHQISAAQYDQYVQRFSYAMSYAGVTSHAEVSRPEDTAEPLRLSYDYQREKAGDWEHHQIVPQLFPVILPRPQDSNPPVQSITLSEPCTEISTSALKLPEGWTAKLPGDVHVKSPWVTYDQTYRFADGTVYAERTVQILQEKVPLADWKTYKKFADDADLGNEKYIQLTPAAVKSASSSTSANYSKAVNDPKAAKLIAAARLSIQHRQFEAAQSQLDQARSINPEQTSLWLNYGYLEFQRGNMSGAIPDYQKELALYPNHYGVYASLALAQKNLGQEKDAQKTMEKWASVQTDSAAPTTALVTMLLEENHPAEAVAAAEAGVARLPETFKGDQHLQFQLGRAQIAAGKTDKGKATLLALLHITTDANMMNSVAYELGKAGIELPLAESTAQEALAQLVAESKNWTVQDTSGNALTKSHLIGATWDTLGWILYREGKTSEAESYIQAAWTYRTSAEIGEHLATIAEAKGDPDQALRYLVLAQAALPQGQRSTDRKTFSPLQKEIVDHIESLRKTGAKEPDGDADETLQQLRTISLGAADGLSGSAEYRLLLGKGVILDLQKIDEKELPGASERIKAAQLPALWPKDSEALLVRNATLNCHAGNCELIFEH